MSRQAPAKTVTGLNAVRSKYAPTETHFVKTDILPLDLILGHGVPRGSMIELASPSGLGKSTLMAHVSKSFCKQGYSVEWFDFEHALTDGLKEGLGLRVGGQDLPGFHHSELVTYGDAEEFLEALTPEFFPHLIVFDSETAMLPDKMADKSILEQEIGLKSRISSNFIQKYKGWARKSGVTMVFINQMRTKGHGKGRFMTFEEDSAGGNALKFYSDIRLRMKKGQDLTRKEITLEGEKEIIYGAEAVIWAVKNKHVRSHIELTLPIVFGKGVSNLQILKKLLIGCGVIASSGSYFKIAVPGIFEGNVQGNKGLNAFFREHKSALFDWIVQNDVCILARGEQES